MGIPDTGYIIDEMLEEVFEETPGLIAVGWTETKDGDPNVEFRFEKTFEDLPYANGKANESEEGLFPDVVSTVKSFCMLRGFQEGNISLFKSSDFTE